ncbi:MAG: pitrilysin family protein [Pseudomonadota bacterium]
MSHSLTKLQKPFRKLAFSVALFGAVATVSQPALAVEIQTVTSDKGVKALLVEDYTVPLIAVSYSFKGGSTQDLAGKEGTARLLTNMLDEGAGDITSQAFQEALDDNGMSYSFNAGLDSFSGSIKTLVDVAPESFELLRLMLNEPRFDEEPLERMKASRLTGLKRAETNPQSIAGKAFREAVFEGHPYSRPTDGTLETMGALTGADLKSFHERVFARDNVVIGVVGAINADDLKAMLDKVFGDLPQKAQLTNVPEANPQIGDVKHVSFDAPQTNIRMALPGLKRDDPEFFAAYIMNHILGGGSFSSRLYTEVREKRGLAYGVYSYLATYDHAGFTGLGTATRAERVPEALEVMQAEVRRMAEEGPTEAELKAAKDYIRGSYAIANLDTSSKIASVLVAIQDAALGLDYIDKRASLIDAVTMEDVKAVAKKLLDAKPTVVTVGRKTS